MSVDIDTLFEMMDEGQPAEIQEAGSQRGEKDKILICIYAAYRIWMVVGKLCKGNL